jgi:hypothetical protein
VGVGSLALCWVVGVPLLRKHIARKFADDILIDMEPFSDSATESQTLADQGVKRYGATTTSTTTAGGQEQQLRKSYDSDDEDLVEEVAEELEKNFSEFTAKEYSVWHYCCSPQSTVLSHHERRNEEMYSNSETFDAKTEELFSFLQILTASVGGTQLSALTEGRVSGTSVSQLYLWWWRQVSPMAPTTCRMPSLRSW